MTYEEAFDVLVFKIHIEHTENFERDIECLKKCAKALAMQIPKKAITEIVQVHGCDHGCNDEKYIQYFCVSCGKIQSRGFKYCPECGQRQDWSDEE